MPDVGIEPAAEADLTERRMLLMAMLDAVYVDAIEGRAVVAIRPKLGFRPIFEVATTRAGSGILLISGIFGKKLHSSIYETPSISDVTLTLPLANVAIGHS